MNKENYDGLRKQLDKGSLDIPSQITILEIAYNLEQQLQLYKDKEDKLMEYIEHNDFSDWHIGKDKDQFRKNDLLQILNEEVK